MYNQTKRTNLSTNVEGFMGEHGNLKMKVIVTKPGEKTMDAIARELGNVTPVVIRPLLDTHLDWGRKKFEVHYR